MDKFNPNRIRKYAATRTVEAIENMQDSLRQLHAQAVVIRDGAKDVDGTEHDLDYEDLADKLEFQHVDLAVLERELARQITVLCVASGLRIG